MSFAEYPQHDFSDAAIRRFLLAQFSPNEQSAFEKMLFAEPGLERRVRFAELELIDDYCGNRLKPKERTGFHQKFLVTASRQKQLEVSLALRNSFAGEITPPPRLPAFNWPRLAWRIVFAAFALMIVLASALVIRKEPQIVKRIIPKRLRPAAVAPPTPEPAHHPPSLAQPSAHRDEAASLPEHEAVAQMIVLRPSLAAENAPVITVAPDNGAGIVRLELMLERSESANFGIVVMNSAGEIVHNVPELRLEGVDRIDFDVQVERLKAGDFQVMLTRLSSDPRASTIYYFRVQ